MFRLRPRSVSIGTLSTLSRYRPFHKSLPFLSVQAHWKAKRNCVTGVGRAKRQKWCRAQDRKLKRFITSEWAVREAAKKVLLLLAGPLRTNPPPPSELNGRWNFGTLEKKVPKKVLFPLMARQHYPPPLLMARPLRE